MAVRRKRISARYLIRVDLQDIRPVIWRQIWVEGQMNLAQLHHVIQAAMGWTDAHLHEFTIGEKHYGRPSDDDLIDYPMLDERRFLLRDLLRADLEFLYLYDFGDDWRHMIRVERAEQHDEPYGAAFVVAGARACPPEDSGGSPGYQQFLDQLAADPHDEDVRSFFEWTGEDFNPDVYDRRSANAALLRMAWNGWGIK
jgi:hypothetical protein